MEAYDDAERDEHGEAPGKGEVRGTDIRYGAHSLRKGGAAALVAAGRPRMEVAAIGGWKSDAAMARYLVGEDDNVGEDSRYSRALALRSGVVDG